jgi:hypothetical protein
MSDRHSSVQPLRLLAALIGISCSPVAAKQYTDVNGVYERMAKAYATLDPAQLKGVFHPKLVAPASDPARPPILNGAAMEQLVTGGLNRLRQEKRSASLSFRITHRNRVGGQVVDLGVLRMVISGGSKPTSVSYARFLTAMVRQPGGQWSFFVDAPQPSNELAWSRAVPAPGAKFDD